MNFEMPLEVEDMLGRSVRINHPPARIVSLVPSQTELLASLDLEEEVVGITKFCIHPEEWFRKKTRIGGTKTIDIDRILSLNPDLVIANKEENERSQVEALATKVPVWISDIETFSDALRMIREVGIITDRRARASELAIEIEEAFASLAQSNSRRVAYFIWRNPWMCVGHGNFIHDILSRMGWENVFSDKARYPEITLDELAARLPDLVILSSEPYPFKQVHIDELQRSLPDAKIILADGEMFSWYGSRLNKAAVYLQELILSLQ